MAIIGAMYMQSGIFSHNICVGKICIYLVNIYCHERKHSSHDPDF
jgi:hypothetical protein